ncbi:microtubule-destabilizing protein 60-like isoform X1 [Gossypium arboreum]|uniref:microtubule-destabilizing protein 60-like isoform X1 n=1 Tax=Gossypium arboreum TaxID=29729 RepID=UPI0008190CC3|nr:microtubule-destabilizing protein 60-like isoform X1 [Gossypium arboreum]
MEVAKHSKQGTPVKDSGGNSGSKTRKFSKLSENSNPNISATKSSKSQKYSSKDPVVYSPRNKLRERKFVVAKKKLKKERSDDSNPNVGIDCKCKEKSSGNSKKCLCVAYENLRASQEDFFKNKAETEVEVEVEEEAMDSVPEAGKVMNLVKAFERLLTTPNSKESEDRSDEKEPKEENDNNKKKKALKWPSEFVLTAENLGLDRRFSASSSSSDSSSQGSVSSRASNGGRRSQRNSSESLGTTGGRRGKKQDKPTSQKPFKLRTEQRGKMKEGEFMKKIQEMMVEEEKQRIPIAQGLPWTTDEPEVLIKPHVKENTRSVDPRLHSEIRASERSEFDLQVAEKMILIKHYKMERERRDKMAEEEEIKKLRKELVPKAQPMPVFDRPFLPTRSSKNPTMAREPKFHMPQHKKTKFCI